MRRSVESVGEPSLVVRGVTGRSLVNLGQGGRSRKGLRGLLTLKVAHAATHSKATQSEGPRCESTRAVG